MNDTSVITFIEPAPVYRVVDSSFRGVPGVSVTAVVTVANRSLSSFVNPLPFTGQSSSGGYVNFDGIYANDTTGSPYGTVARVQFSCGSPSTCGTGELLGVSFSMVRAIFLSLSTLME